MTDEAVVGAFVAGLRPEEQAAVERLVEVVRSTGHPLELAVRWRQLTFGYAGDFHHWICGIAATKKAVVLVFHFGGLLDDPNGRFRVGESKFGRRLDYRSAEEIDESVVRGFVDQAIERLPYFRDNWKAIQAAG